MSLLRRCLLVCLLGWLILFTGLFVALLDLPWWALMVAAGLWVWVFRRRRAGGSLGDGDGPALLFSPTRGRGGY